jgi:hypothetical protein
MKRWACALILPGSFHAGQAHAVALHAPAYVLFDLKPAEAILFENLACMDRYGVKLDSAEGSISDTGKLDDALAVYARCKPHRRIDGQPVVYEVECRRDNPGAEWHCLEGEETMLARIDGILVRITIGDSGETIDQAYTAVKILRAAGPFKKISVDDPRPPATEGFASCHTFQPPGDVTKITCNGGDIVALAAALEMKP